MSKFKLTTKEESAKEGLVIFLQGLKDCKPEEEKEYLIRQAFQCRMIISYGTDGASFLCANLINSIIPYLMSNKDDSIDEIAEECDRKTDEMFNDICSSISASEINKETK